MITMKTKLLTLTALVIILSYAGCSDNGRIRERPKDIVETGPRAEIFQKIMESFPEKQNITESQPDLFASGAGKQVVLTKASPVYVTFISEGASLPNTFGWYSYTKNGKPSTAASLELHVLFPHVSGGVLKQGDRLQLGEGTFPAGTVIGFFLIINGWENGAVNFDRQTFYTDTEFNPEGLQQHVLFKQDDLGDIVLTFEDQLTSQVSDRDYNDIIFTVTDSADNVEVTSFDLTNIVHL